MRGTTSRVDLPTKEKLLFDAKYYVLEEPFLYNMCGDGSIEDAYQKMRSVVSCTIVMLQPTVDTLDWIK